MAAEITFGFTSGRTLSCTSYVQATGAVRTGPTVMTEAAGTGYYRATDAAVVAGDFVIVTDSVIGIVGQGQYKPDVTSTQIMTELTTVVEPAITIISGATNENIYDKTKPEEGKNHIIGI